MKHLIIVIAAAIVFSGCNDQAKADPSKGAEATTAAYWQAVIENNTTRIKNLSLHPEVIEPDYFPKPVWRSFTITETNASDIRASVGMRNRFNFSGYEKLECNVSFNTALLKVGDSWSVDEVATKKSLDRALKRDARRCLQAHWQAMTQGGKELMQTWEQQLKENAGKLENSWKEFLEGLQQELNQSLEQLKKTPEPATEDPLPVEGERI